MSATDVIASNVHVPVRRLYIKRKLVSGDYETDWKRVDIVDGIDQVIEWGSVSYEIDSDPSTDQASFDISGVNLKVINDLGFWNNEKSSSSYFYPDDVYLTRKYTRIKMEAGYIDADGEEQGVCTIFEGLIESVSTHEDRVATINAMSYLYVLKNYPISDRNYTAAPESISDIVNDIFGLDKVSDFIHLETNDPGLDGTIEDPSQLSGDYWEVIQRLAFLSSSVPLLMGEVIGSELDGQVFKFIPREPVGDIKWTFYGTGASDTDIYNIQSYDDEGAKRIVLRWVDYELDLHAQSSNDKLISKYLNRTFEVDVSPLATSDRQPLMNALLSYWENPRETLTFTSKMMLNIVNVMDKISIYVPGVYPENVHYWGVGTWGDPEIVGRSSKAGIAIDSGTEFLVTAVISDLDNWTTTIRCERL